MDNPQAAFESRPVANTIGAFVSDHDDAIHLFNARLPFWFIQFQYGLLDHNILVVVPLTAPETILEMQAHVGQRHIFKGEARSMDKVKALRVEGLTRTLSADPFRLTPAAQAQIRASEPDSRRARPSGSKLRSRSASPPQRSHQSSDKKRSTAKRQPEAQITPDLFRALSPHHYLPDRMDTWESALRDVDLNRTNLVSQHLRTEDDNKTMFPQPRVFLGPGSDRVNRYLSTWSAIRQACIYRVIVSGSQPVPLSTQEWRDVLYTAGNPTLARLLREIFKEPFSDCQVDYGSLSLTPVTLLPLPTIRRMMWELFELNFRWDLKSLDGRAQSQGIHPLLHEENLQNVLATSGLFAFDATHSSSGLASPSLQERLPALRGLRKLVQDWNGTHPAILDQVQDNFESADEILALETAIAKYICQMFFNYFGRPITIPFHLPPS
ncbi:hypothetical protein BDN72DRAFT_906857 [Pluteus cervinus]|uniref:Uncharacterized protein n=1 Tax=Pluteus cervinus TaxID=181527 RepID=A0ACD2ZY11_9AGAR|nr:hypothetical protein BDN72DRAFT_906857 [Pluteus cervinus]